MFFFEFLNKVNPANCWIFAVFLDLTWLVAVDAKLGDSTVVDSNFLTHHGQKLWNFLFNCHLCRQISSSNCIFFAKSSSSSLPKLYVSSSSGVSSLPNFDSHSKVFPSPKAHWKLVVFVALTLNSQATDFSSQEWHSTARVSLKSKTSLSKVVSTLICSHRR